MPPLPPSRASNLLSSSAQANQNKPGRPPKQGNASGDIHTSPSLGSWLKQILPSNRPERGGTLRPSAFQLQKDLEHMNNNKSQLPPSKSLPRSRSDGGCVQGVGEGNALRDDVRKSSGPAGPDGQRRGKKGALEAGTRTALQGTSEKRSNVLDVSGSGSHSSSTPDPQYIRAKQEARWRRRNLKESGDYLGVQGFNPETGKLDVLTPSDSDRSSRSQETQQKLLVLKNVLKDARHHYKSTREKSEQEAQKILLKSEKEKIRRLEKGKEKVQETSQTVTWKRHARQWSSAQEPNLSPIAQSIVETAPASREYSCDIIRSSSNDYPWTGRQSKVCERAEAARRISNSSLIDFDFNSSDKHAVMDYALPQRDRELTKSPDSVETVVRTPHRQSLVDFAETGLSAWELFVNGISFDTSENTVQLQDSRSTNLAAEESSQKAHRMGEGIEAEGKKIRDHVVAQVTPGSFLGTGSEKQDDPGGKKIQVGALKSTESLTAKEEIFPEDASKKCARDILAPRTLPTRSLSRMTDTMEHENTKLLTGRLFPNVMDKSGTRTREDAPQMTEGRRKNMPNWGLWMGKGAIHFTQSSKTSSPRMLSRLAKRSPLKQRKHSALRPELDPNPPNSGRSEPDQKLAPHVALGQLVLTWGMNMRYPSADQEAEQRKQTRLSASGARDRQSEARQIRETRTQIMKDVTMGSTTQTVTECASTHIITTTGCDQPRSATSDRAMSEQKNNNRRAQPGDYQKGGAMYNLPPIATSESSLGISVMRILQKASPRVKLAEVRDEIGITSKCSPEQGVWHTNKRTKPLLNIPGPVVCKLDGPATTDLGIKDVRALDPMSKQQGDGPAPSGQPRTGLERMVDVAKRAEEPEQAAAVGRGNGGTTCVDMLVRDELTALVRAPGRFPDAWDGLKPPGDVVDARNAGIAVELDDGSLGSSLGAGGEFLGVVWCYLLPVWQLYWEQVGPLFNLKSEYWARQKSSDEGTWRDCLTVVLAIPMTLLFIAGYMMALRLGMLCFENGKAVKEWAEDVYW
ncbi:hypothetical protein E4U53_002537 [Claviceps sorghi]|nr:hypothetical protein E4U53_002537 [Claviceps sorghi]